MDTLADAPRLSSPLREDKDMVKTGVKMLATDRGAENGIDVKTYKKDETYCLGLSLAKAFVEDRKTAEYVFEPKKDELDVADWLNTNVDDVTKAKLIAKCEDLDLDPPDSYKKQELLDLIHATLSGEKE